ncbi:MAG: ATP-binding protein [Hyphomicrobiaceae bacterium]|nr:ATP-binding protein [Hyphomicrobiaceae bacterium]
MSAGSIRRTLVRKLLLVFGSLWLIGSALSILLVSIETGELFDNEIKSIGYTLIASKPQNFCASDPLHDCRLEAIALAGGRENYVSYQIRDRDGHVLHRSINAPNEPYPIPVEQGFVRQGLTRYFTLFYPDGRTAVQVAGGAEERFETIGWLLMGMALPVVALLLIGSFLLKRAAKQATIPIAQLVGSLQERDGRHLEPILAQGVPDELTPIVRGVNRLMKRLQAALAQERSFSANCAHELRNPLAAATAQAELLVDQGGQGDAAPLLSALKDLGHKLERLLQLSRTEAGIGMVKDVTDLVATTRFVVAEFHRALPDGMRLRFDSGPSASQLVLLDKNALGILLRNLLDNAFKHSPADTRIDVILSAGGVLRVANSSPVVPTEKLSELNGQFVRGNHAVTGDGLGLYIVSQIVGQADGVLALNSPAEGRLDGFEVVVKLPLADEPANR